VANGSHSFNLPPPQVSCLRIDEIVADLFAGGASEALKQALGVDPAPAYNHEK
jgi:DNA (cytosine-5)-methyltransferase 1